MHIVAANFMGILIFIKLEAMLAAILDFSDRTMIQANHPRFSCTSDMYLTIYGIIFSGPLIHTDTPSGTGVYKVCGYTLGSRSSCHCGLDLWPQFLGGICHIITHFLFQI